MSWPDDATYLEDLPVGERRVLGTVRAEREEMLDFARTYDPQTMHVDPEAASETPHGGVIASGWYTGALSMRVIVREFLQDAATVGAVGADSLRFHAPVRPDDELTVAVTVEATEDWSRPEWGKADCSIEVRNQDGERVFSMLALVLFAKRDP